jgi:DNA-binding NtrC family response regulator
VYATCILPEDRIRIVLYEEARDRTHGSPSRFLKPGLHPRSVTHPTVKLPRPVPSSAARRALVVDDEPTIRSAVARYLRKRGWYADEAEDGKAALLKLEPSPPGAYQIVISDLRMPHCSGDELHDWLAEHRPDLFACLILTTGDLTSPALDGFIARTPRPVIEKPFELAVLGEMVEAVLHGR